MSLPTRSTPAVITVRPTRVRTGGSNPKPPDDWHHRFTRPITVAAAMAFCIWLAHSIISHFSSAAGYWLAIAGMVATGTVLYRELLNAGLILNRIVGALIVLVTLPLPFVFALAPFALLRLSPSFFAAISLGLAIGWAAHALNLLNEGEPPCSTAL